MQNQVNRNAEMSITNGGSAPQFIIQGVPSIQGGVVNLADLIKTSSGIRLAVMANFKWILNGSQTEKVFYLGDTEEAIAVSSLDSGIQQVVNESGQRVITILTDQHGNLQTNGLGQPFFVTMQDGRQGKKKVHQPA